MITVAYYILNSVAAFLSGCLWAIWFGNAGYGSMSWLAFILGVMGWFAFVIFVAMMWFILIGAIDKHTYWEELNDVD